MKNFRFHMRRRETVLISVIIPIYNVRAYLEEALDSVLHQTYTDIEVILVDDGSIDGSGGICDEYARKDTRIKVIHQENKGLSAARNIGLDNMKGELCAFLDPDDAFHPDMLHKMLNAMQEYAVDVVECRYATYDSTDIMNPDEIDKKAQHPIAKEGLYRKREALHMHIYGEIATNVWNKLYKSKMWKEIRFPEGQNYEDVDIILSLLIQADSLYMLDDVLVMYRNRPGSITATKSLKNLQDKVLAYKHYVSYVQAFLPEFFSEEHLRKAREKYYVALLAEYFIITYNTISNKKKCMDFLIQELHIARKKTSISEHNMKILFASFLCFYTPPLFSRIIYQIYKPFRKVMLKSISKRK